MKATAFMVMLIVKGIVILDKDAYSKSVETVLKDSSKCKNILVGPDKDLNYVIVSEKKSH